MADGHALDMGRYAVFVWPAYGISTAVLIGAAIQTVLRARRWRREAEREVGSKQDRSS